MGQIKVNAPKAKVAAATVPPTREDELTKQHQTRLIPWWVRSRTWYQLSNPQGPSPEGLPQVGQGCLLNQYGEEVQGAEVPLEPLPNLGPETPR